VSHEGQLYIRVTLRHCAALTQCIGLVNVWISLSNWDGSSSVNKKNSESSPPLMETAKKNYAMYQQMCDFDKITSK